MFELQRNQECILDIVDGVGGVSGGLVLGGVSDQTLILGEGDVGRSNSVTLIVDENLDLALLHHTDTAVSSSQILDESVSGVMSCHDGSARRTYNTDDGAIVVDLVSLNGLNESQRREEEGDPTKESQAKGH